MNRKDSTIQQASPLVRAGSRVPWLRVWACAFCLTATALGSEEAFWRSEGFRPSVSASKDLWHFWRERTKGDDGNVIVFLGTSRMRAAFDPDTISEIIPSHEVVQLGIDGRGSHIPILRGLANDEQFRGIVVCSLLPLLFDDELDHKSQLDYEVYHPSWGRYINAITWSVIQSGSTLLLPDLRLDQLVRQAVEAKPVARRRQFVSSFRRSLTCTAMPNQESLDESISLFQQAMESDRRTYANQAEYGAELVSALRLPVSKIHHRGGSVIFVLLPQSRNDERFVEESDVWFGSLVRSCQELNCPYIDYRELVPKALLPNGSWCSDGVHTDAAVAPALSQGLIAHGAMVDILKRD